MEKLISKIKAFTLAEMLISLSIIGVIAALTVPAVVNNSQKRANAALLKKAVVKLDEVVEFSIAESRFQPYPKCFYSRTNNGDRQFSQCAELYNFMKENLRVSKICNDNGVAKGCMPQYKGKDTVYKENNPAPPEDASQEDKDKYEEGLEASTAGCGGWSYDSMQNKAAIVTTDGMIFIPYVNDFSEWPIFAVDVNGKKAPNRFGYDVFFLQLFGGSGEIPSFGAPWNCEYIEKGGLTTQEMINFSS